jgi:hypothetical protein
MCKRCSKCGKIKSLDHYYNHAQMRDGKANYCISCKKEYDREYRRAVAWLKPLSGPLPKTILNDDDLTGEQKLLMHIIIGAWQAGDKKFFQSEWYDYIADHLGLSDHSRQRVRGV